MIETRQQAEALHAAIEAREDAWRDLNNCVLMPERQMPDDRLAASANRYVEAERAVTELGHGLALDTEMLEVRTGDGVVAKVDVAPPRDPKPAGKRRGRPPKAQQMTQGQTAAPAEPAPEPERRSVEQVKADEAAAAAGDPAAA